MGVAQRQVFGTLTTPLLWQLQVDPLDPTTGSYTCMQVGIWWGSRRGGKELVRCSLRRGNPKRRLPSPPLTARHRANSFSRKPSTWRKQTYPNSSSLRGKSAYFFGLPEDGRTPPAVSTKTLVSSSRNLRIHSLGPDLLGAVSGTDCGVHPVCTSPIVLVIVRSLGAAAGGCAAPGSPTGPEQRQTISLRRG